MPAAASEPSTAAGSSALYLPLAVTLPRTAPAARVSPESTVMVSREMLPLPSETMNSPAYRPSCSSGIPTSSADVLVAGGVDRRGVDRGLRRLDRGWPYLAADGGGLVLGGSGLEQGTTDLNDRRRLSDEPGGEIAPASEGAELVHLGDVGEGRPALVGPDRVQVDHLGGWQRIWLGPGAAWFARLRLGFRCGS